MSLASATAPPLLLMAGDLPSFRHTHAHVRTDWEGEHPSAFLAIAVVVAIAAAAVTPLCLRQVIVIVQVNGRNVVVCIESQILEGVRLVVDAIILECAGHVQLARIGLQPHPCITARVRVYGEIALAKKFFEGFLLAHLQCFFIASQCIHNANAARAACQGSDDVLRVFPPWNIVVEVNVGVGVDGRHVWHAAQWHCVRAHTASHIYTRPEVIGLGIPPVRDVGARHLHERLCEVCKLRHLLVGSDERCQV
ncbi:hypothetical protein, conserved [Leishmania tarentolae]|uniref:Uncharacterized protein n=1 Tax=Leishmania tarentolae TaxID=5689 RepID=A0A640KFT0_LEITA|nr:hypothetical protein, conserved [Leishmania tarentolae]